MKSNREKRAEYISSIRRVEALLKHPEPWNISDLLTEREKGNAIFEQGCIIISYLEMAIEELLGNTAILKEILYAHYLVKQLTDGAESIPADFLLSGLSIDLFDKHDITSKELRSASAFLTLALEKTVEWQRLFALTDPKIENINIIIDKLEEIIGNFED